MWALYGWRLVVLPTTLALGCASILAYDWFMRIPRVSGKVILLLANAVAAAAIPYLVGVGLAAFRAR